MISRVNISLGKHRKLVNILKNVILFLTLFFGFLTLNPSVSSFEPFGTIFGLNGSSLGWYLLFAVLVASFFFRRFWCYVFCPVGSFLDLIASWRRAAAKFFLPKTRKTSDAMTSTQKSGVAGGSSVCAGSATCSKSSACVSATTEADSSQDSGTTEDTSSVQAIDTVTDAASEAVSTASKKEKKTKGFSRGTLSKSAVAFWAAYAVVLVLIILVVWEVYAGI
jgi:hypothetical protein